MSSLTDKKIGFIGAGNMARAIIKGLVAKGIQATQISASDAYPPALESAGSELGIHTGDNATVTASADVLVLAVKPQQLKAVCEELKAHLNRDCVVISIAAGINCTSLENWLGDIAIVRAMPNTPAAIGIGACGLFANDKVSDEQRTIAEAIMQAVGIALYVKDESLIDAVTAVSGSGPAYFFMFIEAMVASGKQLGLDETLATELAIQTALGSASLAQNSADSPAELRRKVTSPNGTTEQAVLSFEKDKLPDIVNRAMQACAERAKTLSEELGN